MVCRRAGQRVADEGPDFGWQTWDAVTDLTENVETSEHGERSNIGITKGTHLALADTALQDYLWVFGFDGLEDTWHRFRDGEGTLEEA